MKKRTGLLFAIFLIAHAAPAADTISAKSLDFNAGGVNVYFGGNQLKSTYFGNVPHSDDSFDGKFNYDGNFYELSSVDLPPFKKGSQPDACFGKQTRALIQALRAPKVASEMKQLRVHDIEINLSNPLDRVADVKAKVGTIVERPEVITAEGFNESVLAIDATLDSRGICSVQSSGMIAASLDQALNPGTQSARAKESKSDSFERQKNDLAKLLGMINVPKGGMDPRAVSDLVKKTQAADRADPLYSVESPKAEYSGLLH